MFVLMYSGPSPKRVEEILERHDVHAWTSYTGGKGAGRTGRHEGTRAWPGETTVVLSVVPAAKTRSRRHWSRRPRRCPRASGCTWP